MHQIVRIDFENYNFSPLLRGQKLLLVHKILAEPETILERPGVIFSYEIKTLLLIKKHIIHYCKVL